MLPEISLTSTEFSILVTVTYIHSIQMKHANDQCNHLSILPHMVCVQATCMSDGVELTTAGLADCRAYSHFQIKCYSTLLCLYFPCVEIDNVTVAQL